MTNIIRPGGTGLVGFVCLLALLLVLAGPTRRCVSQPADCNTTVDGTYLGSTTCIQCHTSGPAAGKDDRFVLLTEYTTWRLQDKHSFSYLALKGARARRMGELLKIEDVSQDASCLNCHAPVPEQKGEGFDLKDGVSCEACHGPAKGWNVDHQQRAWRLKSADQKRAKGMVDLRDPATCATVCMSCHVGNAAEGRVVTHAMYAAGHPPLPNFELALFRQNMPPHWRDKRDVPFFKDPRTKDLPANAEEIRRLYGLETVATQQAHLVMASSLVGVRCGLHLIAQRSDVGTAEGMRPEERGRRWPEVRLAGFADQSVPSLWPQVFMGQADCYGCHHELRRKSWRMERGYAGRPGRPQVQAWPLALAGQGVGIGDGSAELRKHVAALVGACDATPFGAPDKLHGAAEALSRWGQERLGKMPAELHPEQLLQALCKTGPDKTSADGPAWRAPDYDSARQIAAAIWVIYREWAPKHENDKVIREVLEQLAEEFDLRPSAVDRKDRAQLVLNRVLKPNELDAQTLDELLGLSTHGLGEVPADREAKVKTILSALRDRSVSDAILKDPGPFLEKLDEINERGLTEAMRRVNAYDPAAFKAKLDKLAAFLPPTKP
jgi:hypothetical protein